jgi:hypothetical protein
MSFNPPKEPDYSPAALATLDAHYLHEWSEAFRRTNPLAFVLISSMASADLRRDQSRKFRLASELSDLLIGLKADRRANP